MAGSDIVLHMKIDAQNIKRVVEESEGDSKRIGASVERAAQSVDRAASKALSKLTQLGPEARAALGEKGAEGSLRGYERALNKVASQLTLFTEGQSKLASVVGGDVVAGAQAAAIALKAEAAAADQVAAATQKIQRQRGPDGRYLTGGPNVTPPGPPPATVPGANPAAAAAATAAFGANIKAFTPDAEAMAAAMKMIEEAGKGVGKELDEDDKAKKRFHANILEAIPDFEKFGLTMEKIGELANHAFVQEFHTAQQGGDQLGASFGRALGSMKRSIDESEAEMRGLGETIRKETGESEVFAQTFARVWTQTLDPFQALTAARKADADEATRVIALREQEAAATQELANVVDGFVAHLEEKAAAQARMAQQEQVYAKESDLALQGRLDRESAANNVLVQMRERAAQQHMNAINPQIAQQQAFNQTLGVTNNLGKAYVAGTMAFNLTTAKMKGEVMAAGKELGFTAKQMEALSKRVDGGIAPMQALANVNNKVKDGFERTDSVLKRVGMTFTALFVVDRAKQMFEGLLGTLVSLAKEGATYQFQQQSLIVTGKRLGENAADIQKAIVSLTGNFIDNSTAVQALRTVLNTGIGLPRGVQLLKAFEEASLRANLGTKGLTDRVLAGAQALQDRSSRAMGNNTTLQINYGQALKLTNDVLDKQIGATVRVATTQTLAGESLHWFTGLMREASLTAGILNIATNTVVGQMALWDKNMKQLRITFGSILAPVLGAFLKILNDVVPKIAVFVAEHAEMIRTMALGVAVISAVSAAITGLTIAIVSAIALFSFLTPLGQALIWLNGAVILLVAGTTALMGPRNALLALAGAADFMLQVMMKLPEFFKHLGYYFGRITEDINRAVQAFSDRAKIFLDIAVTVVSVIMDFLRGAQANIIVATANMVDRVKQKLRELKMNDSERAANKATQDAIEESAKQHMARYHNIVVDAQRATKKEIERLQTEIADLQTLPESKAKTNSINSANERLKTLQGTIDNLKARGLSMDDILRGAGAKSAEFVKYLDKLLDFDKNFKVGVDVANPNPLLDKIGADASNAANLVEAAKNRMQQAISSLKDSFMSIVGTLSGEVADTFLGDGFTRKLDTFDRKFAEVVRKFKSQVASKDLRLEGLEDSLAKLQAKGIFPKEALDNARALSGELKTMEGTAEDIQSVIRGFFVRKAFDEELMQIKQIEGLSIRSQEYIGDAQAREIARGFALRLKALDDYNAIDVNSSKEIARLRIDIEKQADVAIVAARSSTFRFIAEQIRSMSDFITNEIDKMFDFTAMRQQQFAEFSKQMTRDLTIAEAQLHEQELIDSINRTAVSEQERQLRILAVEAATGRKIKDIQAGTADDSANIWIRTFDKMATSVSQTLIHRVVDYAIKGKLMPAIAKLFGGENGILGTANVEVQLGATIQDSLMRMGDLSETFKTELDAEKAILGDMLTTLLDINKNITQGAIDLQQQGMIRTRQPEFVGPPQPYVDPRDPRFIGPVGGAPFGGDDGGKKDEAKFTGVVNDKLFELSKTLGKVAVGLNALDVITKLFGGELPPSIRGLIKIVTATTVVLNLMRLLGLIHAKAETTQAVAAAVTTKFVGGMGLAALTATSALYAMAAAAAVKSVVPFAAAGGVVNGPMMAVVGEAGPEMILPLTSDVLGKLAGQLAIEQRRGGSQVESRGTGAGGRPITVNVNVGPEDEALARRLEKRFRGVIDEEVGNSVKRRTIGMGGI